MVSLLKQQVMDQRLFHPLLTWENCTKAVYVANLMLSVSSSERTVSLPLSHPNGPHDDVFWSIALGVYSTVEMKAFDPEALKFG
jgi:hypothetical protein